MRTFLVGNPERKRPLGRHRRGWQDNIKMDLMVVWFLDVDWIHLAQDRNRWWTVANTVIHLRVP
jgi:hypothetical protein